MQVQQAVREDPGQLLSVRTPEQVTELAWMGFPLDLAHSGTAQTRTPCTVPFTQMVPQLWQLTAR